MQPNETEELFDPESMVLLSLSAKASQKND